VLALTVALLARSSLLLRRDVLEDYSPPRPRPPRPVGASAASMFTIRPSTKT
jgi:hypothetical protein